MNEERNIDVDTFYCQCQSKLDFFFFYLTKEQKFETIFFLIKLNILREVLLIQQNLGDKLLMVDKKK